MPNDELYIRVKQALTWLKRKGILQKDIAKEIGMAEASFTRALARIKEKNDEDFVIAFHSAVKDFISLDYLLHGTGDLIIENESTFHAKTASTSNIDPSSQVNATISAYIEAIESLKRELRTKEELLAEKDSRLAEKDERIAELKAHNIDLRRQLDQYQNADIDRYPFPVGAAEDNKRTRKSK